MLRLVVQVLKGKLVVFLRSVPLPILSLVIGLLCGLVVWAVLERVQPKAVQNIFLSEMQSRLDQKSRESLISYEYFVSSHISTTKLFAFHPNLSRYLTEDASKAKQTEIVIRNNLPSWLPPVDSWESGVEPDAILLFSADRKLQEKVHLNESILSETLDWQDSLFRHQDDQVNYIMTEENQLFLLITIPLQHDNQDKGYLTTITHVDELFIEYSQSLHFDSESIVALIDLKSEKFIATSDNDLLGGHLYLPDAREDFVQSSKTYPINDGFNFSIHFLTLTPKSTVTNISNRLLKLEKQQRIFTSSAFIVTFSLVFFFLSQHINSTLSRMANLSSQALGVNPDVSKRGNQLLILEEWIGKFIQRLKQAMVELEKRHAMEIYEAEAVKAALLESSPDSIITVDDTGVVLECNHQAEQTFGYSRQELLGQYLAEKILIEASITSFYHLLRSSTQPLHDQRLELESMTASGILVPIELVVQKVQLDKEEIFTIYIHDISIRKQREYEMLCLAKFPGESPSPVMRVNRKGVIIYANSASQPLLDHWGVHHGQMLPTYWINKVSGVFFSGKDKQFEMDCDDRIFTIICAPIVELEYINIYAHEITKERQAEKLALEHQQELVHMCRLSTMGEMSTGIAHELNQPLAAIGNFANGCVRRLESGIGSKEDLKGALAQISTQANRAGEIIRRLRALIGKQIQDRIVVNVNEMVLEVCSFMDFQAKKMGIEIEKKLSPNSIKLKLDFVQIEQVLVNFVRNSLDALEDTPVDKRSLIVSTFVSPNQYLGISIEDSGNGIPEDIMPQLFDAFFTTKDTGMGMGLAISKTIIEDHKGYIEVDSKAGIGCKFTVYLPMNEEKPVSF